MRRRVIVVALAGLLAVGSAGPAAAKVVGEEEKLPNGREFLMEKPFLTEGGDKLSRALAIARALFGKKE